MAHVAKYKAAAVPNMVGHYGRKAEIVNGYRRPNIDPERTPLNYAGAAGGSGSLYDQVNELVSEAVATHERTTGRRIRKDANVLCDWVVTLPEDCPEEREKEFFFGCIEFVRERYGPECCVGGFIHKDESRPHVHIPFVPLRDGRLCASKVVDRADLRTFHKDLGRFIDERLGMHVSVVLDDDAALNRALSGSESQRRFKQARDAAKAEIEGEVAGLAERRASLESEVDALQSDLDAARAELSAESERLECLRRERVEAEGRVGALEREVEEARRRGPAPSGAGAGELAAAYRADERARDLVRECRAAVDGSFRGPGVPGRAESRRREDEARAVSATLADRLRSVRERLERMRGVLRERLTRLSRGRGLLSCIGRGIANSVGGPRTAAYSSTGDLARGVAARSGLERARHRGPGMGLGR